MNGYGIGNVAIVGGLIVFAGSIPVVGFSVAKIKKLVIARIIAWVGLSASVTFVERMSVGEPAGTRMLIIILALLWSMKIIVYIETTRSKGGRISYWQWLAFCFGWLGMRPGLFQKLPEVSLSDWPKFAIRGLIRTVLGIGCIAIAWGILGRNRATSVNELDSWRLLLVTFLLLTGMTLVVHFGFLNVLAGFWRYCGVRCSSLFRAPLLSRSLAEFWGQRWNVAFSEMTTVVIFRPIKRLPWFTSRNASVATFAAFVFSGLLHEVAISLPVGNGFGLPMLYFMINGFGMAIEKRLAFLQLQLPGRIWTAFFVLAPLPLLFHRPFLEGCIWPIIGLA